MRRENAFVLVATIGASAMAFIDGSVVQIALPAIQSELKADFVTLQWVVNIYSLFLGALVLVGGAYGDAVGRRAVFLYGTALFVIASALCGLAWTAYVLVFCRALQGIGAAMMVPQSLAIIAATFPEDTRGRAIGTWSAASALTTALGPPLGGLLVDFLSWRVAFFINLPIGIAVLWLTWTRVPESRSASRDPVDLIGGILATIALGAVTLGLVSYPERGIGDPLVLLSLCASILAGVIFLVWEARAPSPMMPLDLFRGPVFAAVNLVTVLLYGALSGALFLVPYTLITLRGYSAAQAGLAMLPLGLVIGLLSRSFGALGDRIGTRLPIAIGSGLVALSLAWIAWTEAGGSYWLGVFGPMMGIALGMSGVVAPLTTTVMNAVPSERSGVASGINNAAARSAGLLAVAVTVALTALLFTDTLRATLPAVAEPPISSAVLAHADRLLDAPVPAGISQDVTNAIRDAMALAYSAAFRWAMLLNVAFAATAALVCLGLPRKVQADGLPASRCTSWSHTSPEDGSQGPLPPAACL